MEEFVDALARVAAGGTVVDPEVVRQLLGRRRDPLHRLTPREREVLALMAEGRSNAAIARTLVVTEAAVAKHIGGHPDQARPAAGRRRPPPGPGGAGLPPRPRLTSTKVEV